MRGVFGQRKDRLYLPAIVWLLFVSAAAVLSPFLFTEASRRMDFRHALEAPSWAHWLGTDSLGRDLLSRMACGCTVSLGIGVGAVCLALWVGTWFGAIAGYYGKQLDRIMMSFVDMMLCFPAIFLILSVVAILGANALNILCIIGLTGWMGTARLVRAEVMTLKERDFVRASRVMGAGDLWILSRHLLPNAMGPVLVNGVLGIANAVLIEAGLSFLGLGVQPPMPSWGNILTDGKATVGIAWWLIVFPGLAIFLTVCSFNVIGEHFRKIQGGGR